MKTRVETTPHFKTLPDKKTVVCRLICHIKCDNPMVASIASLSKISRSFTVIGIAKCHENDIFDIEKGKKIAEVRANVKAFKKAAKFYETINKPLNMLHKECSIYNMNCLQVAINEQEFLTKIKA